MTPKEKTSDLSVSLPLEAYSGARYLHTQQCDVSALLASFRARLLKCDIWVLCQCSPERSHDARGDVRVVVRG
jgi:hypothetical protein